MFTCGWCNKHYKSWISQCESCGGPMPPPPGMDAGPGPPSAPRTLPRGFAFRMFWSRNVNTIMGAIFTVVSGLFTLSSIAARSWWALLCGLFLFGSAQLLFHGIRTARHILDAFKNGRAVKGRIESVREDHTTTINGRHPWDITYSFQSGGQAYDGKMQTYETATANRYQGRPPVWVLVVDNAPERNTLYPPIR